MSNFYLQQNFGIGTILGFSKIETEKYKNIIINPVDVEFLESNNKLPLPPFESVHPKNNYPVILKQDVISDDQTAALITVGYMVLTFVCFLFVTALSY